MAEIVTKDALKCFMCGDKRQVALLTEEGREWTKYQICAPCTVLTLTALLRGRTRGTSGALPRVRGAQRRTGV